MRFFGIHCCLKTDAGLRMIVSRKSRVGAYVGGVVYIFYNLGGRGRSRGPNQWCRDPISI
jgi:hypothetical protein